MKQKAHYVYAKTSDTQQTQGHVPNYMFLEHIWTLLTPFDQSLPYFVSLTGRISCSNVNSKLQLCIVSHPTSSRSSSTPVIFSAFSSDVNHFHVSRIKSRECLKNVK